MSAVTDRKGETKKKWFSGNSYSKGTVLSNEKAQDIWFVPHNHLQRPNTCLPLVVIHLTQ